MPMPTVPQHDTAEVLPPRPVDEHPASVPQQQRGLRMSIQRPSRETVVLTVSGAVDAGTAARLAEMLGSRLRGSLELVTLDLSGLDFLAVAGVQVLIDAHLQAQNAGMALLIVTGGNRPVERAITACGQHHTLSLHRGPVDQLLAGDGGTPVT